MPYFKDYAYEIYNLMTPQIANGEIFFSSINDELVAKYVRIQTV
jgi:hypothetical protein